MTAEVIAQVSKGGLTFDDWRIITNKLVDRINAIGSASEITLTGGAISGCAISGGSVNSPIGTVSRNPANFTAITMTTALEIASGGTGATTAANARANLGLGTLATQNSDNVAITGGSVLNISPIALTSGGTGASTAANARVNLGLGSMATQNANAIAITGGTIDNVAIGANTTGLFRNPMTAQYDLIMGGTAGASERLGKGANGTCIRVNNSGVVAYGGAIILEEQRANTQIKTWVGTEAQYNALGTKDSSTLYYITA